MTHYCSKGTMAVACVALLYLLATACEARALFQKKNDCEKPPSGSWLVTHRGIDLETLEPTTAGRTVLSLREDFNNAFSGNGSGVYNQTAGGSFIDGYSYVYQIVGIFDPEACTLAGSLYRLQGDPQIIDTFNWVYDGESFSGFAILWLILEPEGPRRPFSIQEQYDVTLLSSS